MTDRARRIIEGLQAKADSTTHEGERVVLLAKIAELRAKHGIAADAPRADDADRRRQWNDFLDADHRRQWNDLRTAAYESWYARHQQQASHTHDFNIYDRYDGQGWRMRCACGEWGQFVGSTSAGTGRRRNGPHADCSHEATKAARARCRRERGW